MALQYDDYATKDDVYIIDYDFITCILYVYKMLQMSLSLLFHMFLHYIFSAILVILKQKVLSTFVSDY